nr:uncharacterized protein LOC111426324 [Onthophagus taurus]
MAKFVVVFLAVCLTISSVYSLQCYDCSGNKDEVCDKIVTCGNSADSANNQPACIKRIHKVNGVTNVKRGCAFVTAPKFDTASECQADDVFCAPCKENKCNSASSLGKFSLFGVLTVFVSYILLN